MVKIKRKKKQNIVQLSLYIIHVGSFLFRTSWVSNWSFLSCQTCKPISFLKKISIFEIMKHNWSSAVRNLTFFLWIYVLCMSACENCLFSPVFQEVDKYVTWGGNTACMVSNIIVTLCFLSFDIKIVKLLRMLLNSFIKEITWTAFRILK